MTAEAGFIEVIIGVGILLAAAIMMGELFSRIHLPVVLGQLIAGMIIGPFALGAFLLHPGTGESILQIGPELRTLGEIGAIVILFMAGLEMTPKEFLRGGKASFTVGALGVVVPFIAGFIVFQHFGFDALQAMMIATALTATSIAISIQVLKEFNKIKSPEARLIIAAAVVDDILAIAVLSVVASFGGADALDTVDLIDVTFTIGKVLAFFAIILIVTIFVMPKVMTTRLWKSTGSIEGIATASFFGAAAIAGSLGLSPIVGAFAVGMALSATAVLKKVEAFTHRIGLIFAPLFFAIIGAQVNFTTVNFDILVLSAAVIAIAIATKLFGCGLPSILFLKDKAAGMRVGIGMISRGEVGLIVAGVGLSSGVLTGDVYTTIVIMVAVTTIITPIWLRLDYRKAQRPLY